MLGLLLTRAIHECATLHTPIPASPSLFITEQETVAEGRETSPRPPRAVFAVGGPARRAPVAAWPPGTPSAVKIPGSVGAPPCPTAARSGCAGSFLLGRRCGAAPALAAVPSAACRPGQAAQNGSASVGRRGWPDHCAECGPDRLWSASCRPARADRLCRSGYRPARYSSRTERMAAAIREESQPSRVAQRTGRSVMTRLSSSGSPCPLRVGQPDTTTRRRRSRRHPGRCPGRRSPSPRRGSRAAGPPDRRGPSGSAAAGAPGCRSPGSACGRRPRTRHYAQITPNTLARPHSDAG